MPLLPTPTDCTPESTTPALPTPTSTPLLRPTSTRRSPLRPMSMSRSPLSPTSTRSPSPSPPWLMPKQSEENDQTYATHTTRLHSEKKSDGTRCATSDGNKDFIDNLVYTQ